MSDKIHSYSVNSHELKLTMSVPHQHHHQQQHQTEQSHHEYGRNLNQDIQLQVIIKENESSLRRTKATNNKTSPVSAASVIKKPVTRAKDLQTDNNNDADDDNTTVNGNNNNNNNNSNDGQYGKINLNQSRDFRMAPQRNDENPYGYVPEVLQHHPTIFPSATEKSGNKDSNFWDSIHLNQTIGNLISDKLLERTWKYLKWPLLIFLLCIFLGLITFTCLNTRNTRSIKSECLNFTTNSNCLLMNATEKENKNIINSVIKNESILDTYSETETPFQGDEEGKNEDGNKERSKKNDNEKVELKNYEDKDGEASEAVLTGSTTLLRPIIVPQLIQSAYREKNYFDKGSKNDYTFIERKPSQKYDQDQKIQKPYGHNAVEGKPITRLQSLYGQDASSSVGKDSKNKTEQAKVIGFTSGHQNNFGIPIEEDERMLRLLNDELIRLEKQTEQADVVGRTESSLIVSPTVPHIIHEVQEYVTPSTRPSFEEIQCQSTSLPMCRGVLQYDLTSSNAKGLYLSSRELEVFETLIMSNCSVRAIEFVCSTLEPECRPTKIGILQPCKRICKSILEACSSLIASSDILTYTFDCDKYPDSYDRNVCEDPTRRSECYDEEFKCEDQSCIPSQWQCDNIKDCSEGEDELGCLVCSPEEFRCRSNEKCLSDEYRCDNNEDCDDGSDEFDCFTENYETEDPQLYPRIFSFASFLLPNYTSENTAFTAIADEDRLAAGSELNETLASASGRNIRQHGIIMLDELKTGSVNVSKNIANFQDSKEIMMTSDSENKMKISHTNSSRSSSNSHHNVTQLNKNESKNEATTSSNSCSGHELRCVSGKCITVDQLCDKIMDCPDGEDELMCNYEERPKSKKP